MASWDGTRPNLEGTAVEPVPTMVVMELEFSGEIIEWRGPPPYLFVVAPEEQSAAIESVSSLVTYGWGCIPVKAHVGDTEFTTALFPRGDMYYVPVKAAVQRAEHVGLGDTVDVRLWLDA